MKGIYLSLCALAAFGAIRMAAQVTDALNQQRAAGAAVVSSLSQEGTETRTAETLDEANANLTDVARRQTESADESGSPDGSSSSLNQSLSVPSNSGAEERESAGLSATELTHVSGNEVLGPKPELSGMMSKPVRHSARQHPEMITPGNFEYLGAIRMPHLRVNGSTFAYGGWALAWRPDGDPNGPKDGLPGSLFITGHQSDQLVAEVSIPRPVVNPLQKMDELPAAEVLQPFGDVTSGILAEMNVGSATPFQIGGMLVIGDRIHWTIHKYYNVDGRDFPSHGISRTDLAVPMAEGPWHLGPQGTGSPEWHSYKHAGYIFEIPEEPAEQWFGGNRLISGLQISTGLQFSSLGPAMFAYRLPADGTPGETSLNAVPLVWYSEEVPLRGHHPADRWIGAAWLTLGSKSAVFVVGRKALGEFYYGEARPGDCTQDKGYHGPPYEAEALFYSPASLIQAAHGRLSPNSVQPWLRWDHQFDGGSLSRYLFSTCGQELGGLAYDRERNLIYLVQISAGYTSDNEFEPLPIIHVFHLTESQNHETGP
jgi:hypothetical protein